jgi:hypothetical protein
LADRPPFWRNWVFWVVVAAFLILVVIPFLASETLQVE